MARSICVGQKHGFFLLAFARLTLNRSLHTLEQKAILYKIELASFGIQERSSCLDSGNVLFVALHKHGKQGFVRVSSTRTKIGCRAK